MKWSVLGELDIDVQRNKFLFLTLYLKTKENGNRSIGIGWSG